MMPVPSFAQGNLLIMPRRVIFNGSKRSQELNLANIGKDTARYAISVINIRMTPEGSFETIDQPDSGQLFAGKYIRFFPRTVTLGPNESQVVKVQLNRTEEMAAGEYRSHIYFRAVPAEKPLGEPEMTPDTGISVHLVPVFGISIPVIIRVGEASSLITVADLAFRRAKDSVPSLLMTFNRKGNASVYGDVAVDFISEEGKATRVGMVNGLAIYTPNPFRRFSLPLDNTNSIDYRSGKLHVTFTEQATSKPVTLAEAELKLN